MPPVTVKSIAPLDEPLQLLGVALALRVKISGSVTVADIVAVQPFESVTVTVYVPAVKPLGSSPVKPLFQL